MNIDQLSSLAARVLFGVAFALLGLAVLERAAFAFGYTILRGSFSGGRMLELSGIVLTFVIAILLRQIRDLLRREGGSGA